MSLYCSEQGGACVRPLPAPTPAPRCARADLACGSLTHIYTYDHMHARVHICRILLPYVFHILHTEALKKVFLWGFIS